MLDLRANTGRYENINYNDRICKICNDSTEDEYHFLLECNIYDYIRSNFIPAFYYTHPSHNKFKLLMNKKNIATLLNIARYVIVAMKHREAFIKTANQII